MPSTRCRIVGREEGQREVAEDDRRHAGQHLEDRLDDLAHAGRRVLRQVDRGQRPSGTATTSAIGRQESVPHDEREHAEGLLVAANSGDHFVPNRKSPIGTSPKKPMVSTSSETMIASVVRTDTSAAPKRHARIAPSQARAAEARRPRSRRPRGAAGCC